MIADLVRRFIARPIAQLAARIPFEPVAVAGALLTFITLLRDQLDSGADLETALTATIIAVGTYIVRQNVWPAVKVNANGVAEEPLGEPITGLDD